MPDAGAGHDPFVEMAGLPVYEVTVARSYAGQARDWLEDAALEYGGAA